MKFDAATPSSGSNQPFNSAKAEEPAAGTCCSRPKELKTNADRQTLKPPRPIMFLTGALARGCTRPAQGPTRFSLDSKYYAKKDYKRTEDE